jgi:hypothetical protein
MNLATWRDDALARGIADADHLDDVAHGLAILASGGDRTTPAGTTVCWVLRHAVCRA